MEEVPLRERIEGAKGDSNTIRIAMVSTNTDRSLLAKKSRLKVGEVYYEVRQNQKSHIMGFQGSLVLVPSQDVAQCLTLQQGSLRTSGPNVRKWHFEKGFSEPTSKTVASVVGLLDI